MKAAKDIVEKTSNEVKVTLKCGMSVRFFVMGLSDKEYIKRAKKLLNRRPQR